MSDDTRALSVRVRAIGNRFAAQAIGYRKYAAQSLQDAQNAERDAATLLEAAAALERAK